MRTDKKITAFQLYMMLMLFIGISNHVLLIPVLLSTAKRDSWIGAAAAILPALVWVVLLYITIRTTDRKKLTDWLHQRYGIVPGAILRFVLIVYFAIVGFVSLLDTITWTQVTYLPRTPRVVIALAFLLVCWFAAKKGIRAIAVTSGILLPGVVFLGYLVASANLQYKDYSLLFPLFTHGYTSALYAMGYTCGALFELTIVLFLQQHVSNQIRPAGLIVMCFIIVGLTLGPLTGSLAMFGPFESAYQRYPAFEQWRMVTMGKFISHLDFFSIYQWIAGSFVRISLSLFLIGDIAGIRQPRNRTLLQSWLGLLFLAGMLIPFSDVSLLDFLQKWFFPGEFILHLVLTVSLVVFAILPAGRRKESSAP